MPLLPGLAVVFVGIAGGGHTKVDHQVRDVVHALHVANKAMPEAAVRALARHKGNTKDVVKKLHAEGVVSFEVVGGKDLRLVVYDADGAMKTFLEFPLTGGALAADDLDTLKSSLADDLADLRHEPAKASEPAAEPAIEIDATPTPTPTPTPKPTPEIAPAPTPEPQAAAPDAVSASEIEAMTTGDDPLAGQNEVHATAPTNAGSLRVGASVGFGVMGREFTPGPSTVVGYSSTPVAMFSVEGHIAPSAHTRLAVLAERSLAMATPMNDTMAATSIARWEAQAGYVITRGNLELAPQIGIGRRTFSIDSVDPSRTPDGEYNYLIAGVAAAMPLGHHLSLRGAALFEPVVSGYEPTEMALGDATRWAMDTSFAVELRFTHVFARVGGDWQRFSWSWDMAGARGAGGAVDNYASGTLSVGAEY